LGYARKAGLVDEAISAPRSMIIFSTAPGAYAYDGVDGNSPFAAALLNSLSVIAIDENADRDIETGIANTDANRVGAIKRAMMQVARDSDGEQTPYMNGPALDEVCLSACTYVTRDQARTILANGGYVTGSVQGALDWAADEQEQIYLWRSPSREDSDSELLWLTKPLPAWTGGFSEEIPQPAGIGELESTPP
jgi:hypothetical protein